ncbi:MAG: hypothetical protein ABIR24_13635 [Verrucomicrobiota bacterium]
MKKHYLKLAPTEQALLAASATIFSAFLAAGQSQPGQEKDLAEKSVDLAITIAERIDQIVSADDELA